MPPRTNSRHQFSLGITDAAGRLYLSDRDPYRFQSLPDNIQHTCIDGDTLQGLARRFFSPISSAELLWWIIADFQPDPIIDPTIALAAGQVLVIPSLRTVQQAIFSPARAQVPET